MILNKKRVLVIPTMRKCVLLLTFILIEFMAIGQNINYYVGLETDCLSSYRYKIVFTYPSGSPTEYIITKSTSVDTCYNFLKANYSVYNSTFTSKLPSTITILKELKSSYNGVWTYWWVELDSKPYLNTQVVYNFTPSYNDCAGTMVVYVDAPVTIRNITQYMTSNIITERCLNEVDLFINPTAQSTKTNVGGITYKLKTKSGTWVNLPQNFNTNNLISLGYVPNDAMEFKVITTRLIPGSASYAETIETLYEGPIIYAPLTGISISAPTICSGDGGNPHIKITGLANGEYVFTGQGIYDGFSEQETITDGEYYIYVTPDRYNVTVELNSLADGSIATPCPFVKTGLVVKDVQNFPTGLAISTNTPIICSSSPNSGQIKITGTNNLQLYKNNVSVYPATNHEYNNMGVGTYYATASNYTCVTYSDTISIAISNPSIQIDNITAPTCHSTNGGANNNGSVTFSVPGGKAPVEIWYSIPGSWSKLPSNLHSGLSEGGRTYYAKDACNNFTDYILATVPNNATNKIAVSAAIQDYACKTTNASISFSVTTGTRDSAYLYSGTTNQNKIPNGNLFDNISNGTYKVRVSNAAGCFANSIDVPITRPGSEVTATVKAQTTSCNGENIIPTDAANIKLHDGSISVNNASGGWGTYKYARTEAGGTTYGDFQSSSSFSNLSPGNYYIKVQDINGCEYITPQPISVSQANKLTVNPTKVNDVICYHDNIADDDGVISYTITNGNIPNTPTLWLNGGNTDKSPINAKFTGLTNGTYSMQITDSKGCSYISGGVTIDAPTELLKTITNSELVKCHNNNEIIGIKNNGKISITGVSGGYGGLFSYQIKGPGELVYKDFDATRGLSVGLYNIKIMDGRKSCDNYVYPIEVKSNPELTISGIPYDEICTDADNGKINFSSSGGFGSKTFKLNSTLAEVSDREPDKEFWYETLKPVGDYKITVSDSYCQRTTGFITIEDYTNPKLGENSVRMIPADCYLDTTGSLQYSNFVKAIDGKGLAVANDTFYFDYNFPNTTKTDKHKNKFDISAIEYNKKLREGWYRFYFKDINGCESNKLASYVSHPSILSVSIIDTTDVTCYNSNPNRDDGQIEFVISGGNNYYDAPYLYKEGNYVGKSPNGNKFIGISKGNYTITFSDSKGCKDTSDNVYVDGPDTRITATKNLTLVDCHPSDIDTSGVHNNGTFYLTNLQGGYDPDDGYSPYKFSIKRRFYDANYIPNSRGIYDSVFTNKEVGYYYIQVKDEKGCESYIFEDTVRSQPELIISGMPYNEVCEGTNNGRITFSSSGGVSPHTYVINSSEASVVGKFPTLGTPNTYTMLSPANDYQITVTDNKNCSRITNLNDLDIKPYKNPILRADSITMDSVICYGQRNGELLVREVLRGYNVGGDTFGLAKIYIEGDYAPNKVNTVYNISDYKNIHLPNLPHDSYKLRVEDVNHCFNNPPAYITVEEPDSLWLRIDTIKNETCFNQKNGFIRYSYHGGNDTSYLPSVRWNSFGIIPEHDPNKYFYNLANGNYELRIEDYKHCFATDAGFVDGPNTPITVKLDSTYVDCHTSDSGNRENGTILVSNMLGGYDPVFGYTHYLYSLKGGPYLSFSEPQSEPYFGGGEIGDTIPVGNYTVKIIDKEGCQNYTFPITVRSNDSLTFKTYLYDEVCENTNTGKIHLSTEGGAGKHSYYMTSTDTSGFDRYPMTFDVDSAIYTSLPPAFGYQITVIDTNMCSQKTLKDSLPIYEYFNPKIEAGNFWFDSVHCYGETNGSVEVHGTFGWHHKDTIGFKSIYVLNRDSVLMYVNDFNDSLPNEGYTTDSIFRRNDFASGKYYFKVKDDSACWSNAVGITVEQPATLLITLEDSSHVIGKGENSGILKFSASGGNSGKQKVTAYNSLGLYDTLNTQQNIFDREWGGFIADTFTLKVNDYHNCTHQIDNIIIKEPEFPLTFSVKSKSNALCKANVGEFTLEGHGGWGNYEFKGAGRESFNAYTLFEGLFAGNYDITVTDSMGATYTDRVFIYEPKDSLKVIMDTVQHPTCGDNGVLSYQMSGGTVPYRLSYVPKDTFNVWSPYEYSATALGAGYYRASVFDSNQCQFEVEATLTDLKRLNITSLSIQEYATVDTGQGNGALKAIITGGTNNLYFWYKSTDTLNSLGDTTLITGLLPGIYQFVASSSEGCELSKAIYLPHMYDHPMRLIAIGHERGYETADGFAEFAVPIDTATTVILKHETHPDQVINLADHPEMYNHAEHTLRIENLAGGDYIVIITDTTDRVAFADFHINNYQLFELTNETIVDVIKHDEANGSIQMGCKGGAGNNTYSWVCNSQPSLGLHAKNTEFSTLLDSIQAGTYSLTITDANGHTLNGTYTLQNPPPIVMAFEKNNANCKDSADGFVELKVKGGWGNFQYKVDTAENYANSRAIFDLEARDYLFYAVDKRGAIESIMVNIGEPEYLRSWVKFIDSVNCFNESNGTIHFTVTGGTQPYEFKQLANTLWNRDTLDYNLAEGYYTYQFTDSNGCTGLDTLNVYMPQPDTLLFSNIWEKQATCGLDNAAISVTTQGGTEPYRYQWTNSRGIVIGTEPSMDSLVQLEQYYLAAFDYNNCIAKHNLQINSSTAPRVDSLHISPVICFGDTSGTARVITASAGAPFAPYYFEWSNADTSAFSGHFPKGDHYVTIKDTNNCATRRWFYMPQPDSLHTVLTGFTDAKCFGSATGFIQVKAKGGVGKYNFNWNTGDTVPVLDSLVKGAYALTLSDSNNCIFIDTFNIRQPEVLQSSLNYAEHLKCKADNNGLIAFSLQGGTAPYKYKLLENTFWLQGTRATGLAEGTYTYHFSDANECISPDTLNVAITAPDSLLFKSIDITHTTCNTNNGSIGVSLKGGVKPYRYKWTDMQNTVLDTLPFIDSLSQLAQYRIEVTDSNNCRVSKIEQISHSTVPTVLKIDTRAVLCWGDTTGTALIAKVDTAWPPAPVSFKWSNGDVGNASERFFEGNHYVVVTDTNGCSSKRYFTVTSPKPLEGHLMDLAEPSCFGDENGFMEIYAKGGVGCYAIKWSNADTRFKAEDLASGTYDYVLSDSNGCLFDETVELSQPAVLHSKIASIDSLDCAGDHDGRVEFNVRGGTLPYYYKPAGSDMWISNTRVYQMNAGKYVYEFTDAHSCVGADTVYLDMVEPDSLLFDSLNVQHTTCNKDNGSIFFTMKGGTPPYNYEWTNSYREVLSTQNYMDGLKRQNQYWLKVLDKKNCKFEFDKQIYGSSGPAIDQIGITDVLCIGDSTGRAEVLKVTPAEPFSPYYIEWSLGDTGMVNSNYYVGTHYATVIDATGCDSRRYFDMHGPDSLWVQVLDSAGAKCFNSTDGYISLAPKGGVGGYRAQWSNGDTTFNNINLPVGTYQLVLTDSNRCSYQKTFEISQPDSIIINLGDDVTICPGNTYTLDGFEFAGHEWTLDGAPFSRERFAHLSQEGTYNVWVSNENGCIGTDEFYLTIGNDALKAGFLMTSESNMGDTLKIIELSNLPLDSLQWAYNNDVFLDFTTETDPAYMLVLKSYSTGIYNIGLTAYSGGCISTKVKQVEIIDRLDTTDTFDYMGYNPLIESLHIAPNPSNGEFVAKITLREVADIQLVVYGVDKGNVIDMRESSGLDYYEIAYTLTNQQTGVYVLIVTASNERKQTKLIFK